MKKIKGLILGTLCISFLSGCGGNEKTLNCSYNISEDNNARMEYVINFDQKGEKLLSYTQSAVMDYGDTKTDEEFESEYENSKDSCDSYKDIKGTKCDVSKSKKEIRLDLKVTLSELDESAKEKLFISEIENKSYDEFKTYMEDSGFTCK